MAKKTIQLSVAIAVYNEERHIGDCLSSVSSLADEIIIVDGGSTDATLDIARKYTDRIIQTSNPPVFHINKQKALDACEGEWILQIDADERVTDKLCDEIKKLIKEEFLSSQRGSADNHTYNGYYIPRQNYFWGHLMKKGGLYPDYVIRLVRRGHARFPCKSVHEQIEVDGAIGYLTQPFTHISYISKREYWRKAATYTSLTAREMKSNGIPKNIQSWVTYSILNPLKTFFTLYIRHKGFIDGLPGLQFAWWSGLHHYIAYRKYLLL